jgi:CubicO group peptidase (beta-lactamase class C family)
MKTLLRILLCLFFSAAIQFTTYGQTKELTYDSLMNTVFPENGPGGTVLLSKAGKILYNKAYGMANLELNVPMTTEKVFRLGSLSKQFTAVCILKLVEEGKLTLQDNLTKFIPDYPLNGKTITIANLLNHSSGIKNYTGLSKFNESLKRQDLSPKELIALFKDLPLDFEPGSNYRYSNSGYVLLGYIIELLSRKAYRDYVRENIFVPLKMDHSYYDQAAMVIPGRTSGYRKKNNGYENSDFLSMTLPYAAGSLMSTTGDLLKWYNGLTTGKLISQPSIELAFTSGLLHSGKETGYGFGWEIGNVQGSKAVKHNGVVNGYFTDIVYLPREKILATILSNYENIGNLDIPASKLAAMALGKPYVFKEVVLTPKTLQKYQAVYSNPNDEEHYITNQNGVLMYYYKGGGKTRLVPYGRDLFLLESTLNSMHFQTDIKGLVKGYSIKGTGITSVWAKSKEIPEIRKISLSEKKLKAFTGKYLFAANMLFEVVLKSGKLFGLVGKDQKELIPYEDNSFYADDIDAKIIFKMNDHGKVTGLTKIQNSEMEARKIE